MEKVHVKTSFSLFVPLENNYLHLAQTELTSESTPGISITDHSGNRIFFTLRLFCKQRLSSKEYEQPDSLCLTKRLPFRKQTAEDRHSSGFILRLKVKQGTFDFRKVEKRFIRLQVDCITSEGQLINSATSEFFQLLPRKRQSGVLADISKEVIITALWNRHDNSLFYNAHYASKSSESRAFSSDAINTILQQAHEESKNQVDFSSSIHILEESSSEHQALLSLEGSESENYDQSALNAALDGYTNNNLLIDQYMVLYNGNAEVVGNFRALNFYKASDFNIKEDIRLLMEEHDPRDVLLKISGVSYKFKPGTTHSTQRRFVGYIAQQIESVVPEAVQLIDGILHVDYESLLPYLSESIKQNFNDIKQSNNDIGYMKHEHHRIKQILDLLYEDFLKREQTRNKEESRTNIQRNPLSTWRRVLLLIFGIALTATAVMVGLFFMLDHKVILPDSPPTAPSPAPPTETPLPDIDPYKEALIDLYLSTNGQNWNLSSSQNPGRWLSDAPICRWFGVSCFNGTLTVLWLAGANLQGTIPESIGNLTSLKVLVLNNNKLTGVLPNSIGKLINLQRLLISKNHLTGTIPDLIGNITTLQDLSLSENNLTGTIPSLEMLSDLIQLSLDDNPDLSGAIPDLPTRILQVTLSGCALNGTIPQSISTLQNINTLLLDHNQLQGTIPRLPSGNVISIYIDLSYNSLEGTVPSFVDNIFTNPTVYLNLSYNKLHGSIQNLAGTKFIWFGLQNNKLSGEVSYYDTSILEWLDISNNMFTSFNSSAPAPSDNFDCDAHGNPFRCPIPDWVLQSCNATCI